MFKKDIITVVTPTYNRAYILGNCYKSLKLQTSKSFVWMIIDDGSTDNTQELVEKWIAEKEITIIYLKKENGGKASALNMALNHVDTEYFVCLDSDDTFTIHAIELALDQLKKTIENEKICGVMALRNSDSGEVLGGKRIPDKVDEATVMDITDKFRIRSEFIQFYKMKILSKYRFPIVEGEKFISPEYIAREVNRNYKFKISQENLCVCEYLSDGLTRNKLRVIKRNPKGYTLVKRQSYELAKGFVAKVKHGIMYIAGCILSREKEYILKSPHKIITLFCFPLGWLAYKVKFSKGDNAL
ncbi:glycosyltransferase family 2 protein [Bacillus solimangrovi]|uniref:Glycosyltransferase 2-like domain-containing protein n=1 Tax=Bacillus solimangrovi TaxID=1305675 RepID=A0A1E5LDJ5_9BACI|nr:glycosyltransferase family 2 protein [Bacillus solimangrovi]OEH92142.1 hypothetical protein BFG57_02395 [Bacillus solimangrovi]